MSRSNDGLPMLPPWLSDSEVTQVGQQIEYEAPPVQNLPHDELIEDTPAPKRRFKRPAPEGDRSDSPGPRKEKRRKPWRRDKNDDHQVEDHADDGHAPRPADQWSNPAQQQDLDSGWQSVPPPDQRPGPADRRPSDRSPDSRPADPYQSGPAPQQYRPGPDTSWQQGPAQTGERPATHLPTRTPSEPPAEFQPLGPRPPQPVDQQSTPPHAQVPPQAPVASHAPVPPQSQASRLNAAAPVAPAQPHASSPQIPVAPQQPPAAPHQPPAPQHPQPQAHTSAPQIPVAPVPPQQQPVAPHQPQPQAHMSAPQIPVAPPQPQAHASSPVNPIAPATPQSHTSGAQYPVADPQSHAPGPASDGGGQASAADHRAVSEQPGPPTSAEPPSWLEGPRSTAQAPDRGPDAETGPAAEDNQITGGAMPAQTDVAASPVSSSSGSTAPASSAAPADAPPSWLEPADSANTPAQPTAQRPLPRLPDLPPPPNRSETAVGTTDSAASVSAPTPVASDSAAANDRQGSSGDVTTDSAAAAADPAVGPASSSAVAGPNLVTSDPTSAPIVGDSAAPNVTASDSAAVATDRQAAPGVTTGSGTAAPDRAVGPESSGEAAARGPEFAARGSEAAPIDSQAGNREQLGDQPRIPGSEAPSVAADASLTRGRHRLPSESTASPADQVRSAVAGAAAEMPHQAAAEAGQPFVAADGPEASRGASQSLHAPPATHSSGFEHPLPSQPNEQGAQRAPEQPWHSGQSAAEAAPHAASTAQPSRSFSAPADEPAPGPAQRHNAGAAAMGQAPVGEVRGAGHSWQGGPSTLDQQGRPAPQSQAPIAPGPDTPGPRHPAPMQAPADLMPGPQGYAQAPMAPNQHSAPSHSAPPQYPSAPQHPVQPQPPLQPQHQAQQPVPPQHSAPPPQWQGGGQGQPPLPSPSLDNVPIRGRAAKKPAGSGWRKAVHHVSGGAINPGMSAEERRLQELVARIRQPVRGDYRIAVLSLKGGVGKTTTTMGLGSTFASIRGDRVIAVDANPDFGTLSQRVPLQTRSTVRDLLLDSSIQRYSDVRRHTSQATSRLEVLASERDPAASEAFNEDEYRAVARILQRFYNIILTDCGTGLMHSAMAGVLELAHSLVLISSPAIDGARSAAATLDWLSLHGHDHLVRNAVVVINSPRAGSPNVGIQQLREYFLSRCRAVHIIPFDQHMSEGAEIDLHRLHKQTKRAYVELAATVADDFATDHRRYRG